jgi:hypothetical protein
MGDKYCIAQKYEKSFKLDTQTVQLNDIYPYLHDFCATKRQDTSNFAET